MAVPSSEFSLQEVNDELGVSGQSLSSCIALAGKTGVWTKLSDFAGYSALAFYGSWAENLYHSFAYSGGQRFESLTSTPYGWSIYSKPSWVNSYPSAGASGTTNITIAVSSNSGTARDGIIMFRQNTTLDVYMYRISQDGRY